MIQPRRYYVFGFNYRPSICFLFLSFLPFAFTSSMICINPVVYCSIFFAIHLSLVILVMFWGHACFSDNAGSPLTAPPANSYFSD